MTSEIFFMFDDIEFACLKQIILTGTAFSEPIRIFRRINDWQQAIYLLTLYNSGWKFLYGNYIEWNSLYWKDTNSYYITNSSNNQIFQNNAFMMKETILFEI